MLCVYRHESQQPKVLNSSAPPVLNMFSSVLRASLVALVASAVAVTAAPGLSLTLSGANKVDGVQNLKVTATITNTGDETLKLLNDPRGPLNKFPTESFVINHEDSGAAPAFTGARVC